MNTQHSPQTVREHAEQPSASRADTGPRASPAANGEGVSYVLPTPPRFPAQYGDSVAYDSTRFRHTGGS